MKESAGLLLFKRQGSGVWVLLGHPGGPFWVRKDEGSWSIPKGERNIGEETLQAAIRELAEETGCRLSGPFHPLGHVIQRGRKRVVAWAVEGDFDPRSLKPNLCEIEWPPRSGKRISIPEIDRVEWFPIAAARQKIIAAQTPFLDRLADIAAEIG